MPAPAGSTLRLAEVLGALSLATDIANGQAAEHGLRLALLASRLVHDQPLAVRRDVYWTGLLRYLGCNAFAMEEARWSAGDDIALRASFLVHDIGRPREFVRAALTDLGRGAPLARRIGAVASILSTPSAPLAHAQAQCDAALHCGRKLAMPEGVLNALAASDERYDGSGLPDGLAGAALPLAQRVVELTRVAVVHATLGGVSAAVAEVRRRSGGHLDPEIAARFAADAPAWMRGLELPTVWDEFLDAEPGVWIVDDDHLTAVFDAFASIADLKSGWFAGHSHGVAALAERAAEAQGLAADAAVRLRRAGLLHDLGRVAVTAGVWDKPGAFSTAEWERVHLHSYWTDRVLRRSPALAPYADIAGRAHERLDGRGYHRGEHAPEPAARLLAAADVFQACREARPHRAARSTGEAARVLRDEAAAGRLCPRAVDAVLAAMGEASAPAREHTVLSAREVEVLRLLVRGLSNKAIARELRISPRTVQHHTVHIYAKTGVKSRAGAALWAVQEGLLR